jgi:protein-S-isoprenylcysteine O-methyltransferase Ste14
MDHTSAVPLSSLLAARFKNLLASAAVVALALAFHRISSGNRRYLSELYGSPRFSFTGDEFLTTAAIFYTLALALFFLTERDPGVSKSLRFWRVFAEFLRAPAVLLRQGLPRDDRVAVLATLLKALFGPLMAMASMTALMGFISNGTAIAEGGAWNYGFRVLFDRHGYWFVLQLLILVDVFIFTIGYLVELPRLGNEIRSVDPTLLGWTAALVCYAPFNVVVGTLLGPPGSDMPRFGDSTVHFSLNALMLALMAAYTWASVALGFKASNLTHRGIVDRGPYRLIRHPAYTCKNMAWWIGSIPIVSAAFDQSSWQGIQALASVIGWTMLYVLRAVTEEDHLRGVDGDYAAYAAKVRYRFIPGIL